mgnify:CR=1 FL=1
MKIFQSLKPTILTLSAVILTAAMSCKIEKYGIIGLSCSHEGDRWNHIYSINPSGDNITQLERRDYFTATLYQIWSPKGQRMTFIEHLIEHLEVS